MSLFRRATAAPVERRTATLAATLRAVGLDTRAGGKSEVDADSSERVAAVWGCGRIMADVVGTMPWDVTLSRGEPVAAPPLISSPDGGGAIEWKRRVMWSKLLRGNAYGFVTETTPDGRYPNRIDLLSNDAVVWRKLRDGRKIATVGDQEFSRWPQGPLWHVTAYERSGDPEGMSPIEYARSTIAPAIYAADFSEDFFETDCHPGAVVYSDQELDAQQAKAIKDAVKAGAKDRDTVVLGAGLKWQQMQVSPSDSQFLDTMRWSAQQICSAVFGVPAELLGYATSGSSVTYANAQDRDLAFLKYGLGPWLYRFEAAMSRLLPPGMTVKFNSGGLLRADIKTRFEVYGLAANIQDKLGEPVITAAEMRKLEDLPPIPAAAAAAESASASAIAEAVQKIYLGVGTVVTTEEARRIVNLAGAGLASGPLPKEASNAP